MRTGLYEHLTYNVIGGIIFCIWLLLHIGWNILIILGEMRMGTNAAILWPILPEDYISTPVKDKYPEGFSIFFYPNRCWRIYVFYTKGQYVPYDKDDPANPKGLKRWGFALINYHGLMQFHEGTYREGFKVECILLYRSIRRIILLAVGYRWR